MDATLYFPSFYAFSLPLKLYDNDCLQEELGPLLEVWEVPTSVLWKADHLILAA